MQNSEQPSQDRTTGEIKKFYDGVYYANSGSELRIYRHYLRLSKKLGLKAGQHVLDVACGRGEWLKACEQAGLSVSGVDLSERAIEICQINMPEGEFFSQSADSLPFADNSFDVVTMSFGLRNVTDQARTFASIMRVLKPGGRVVILEFSHPVSAPVKPLYDAYSFAVLPLMGKVILNDAASYRYLAESIRMHPSRNLLEENMGAAGYVETGHIKKLFGIVAIHYGVKG